uniref:Uncharacterized protein n=1 Tax=Anguilla anguilla TaxID=7936 RepID=A0A0E9QJE8_ANGAN
MFLKETKHTLVEAMYFTFFY